MVMCKMLIFIGIMLISCVSYSFGTDENVTTCGGIDMQASEVLLKNLKITVVYDNYLYKEGLRTGWGFGCVIEGAEKTILFDTGGDAPTLLYNMEKLGIHPENIDTIVLSHIHGDHVGGLFGFLRENSNVTVHLLKSFDKRFKEDVRSLGAKVVEIHEPAEICKGVYTTGEMGFWIKEQSLIVNTDKGLIVITGCAHPGIVNIVAKAKDLLGKDVLLVMGGFHLMGKSRNEIRKIINDFKKLGVRYVGASHCSGDTTRKMFEDEYKEYFINVGVGRIIKGDDLEN